MSLIKNLIKEPENKKEPKWKKDIVDGEKLEDEKKPRPVIKSATDLQRLKLEKLMKNPEKPVIIPEAPRERDHMQSVPSFVRNVMGSSAGAGSGEFHVYRHLRRKEYARQKTIQAKSIREQLDDEYQQKLEQNRLQAEEKTAKKRAKRLKKKQRGAKKQKGDKNNKTVEQVNFTNENTSDEEESEEEEKPEKNQTVVSPSDNVEESEIKIAEQTQCLENVGQQEQVVDLHPNSVDQDEIEKAKHIQEDNVEETSLSNKENPIEEISRTDIEKPRTEEKIQLGSCDESTKDTDNDYNK